MKRFSKTFCILFLALLVLVPVLAQEPVNTAHTAGAENQELKTLMVQTETIRSYQDQFISIVQWSLGTVLAIAIALAAFNWYSSKVSYERDIQSLQKENKTLCAELTVLIKEEANAASKCLTEELAGRQSSIEATITKNLEKKIATLSSQLANHKNQLLSLEYDFTEREAKEAVKEKSYAWGIYKYCKLLKLSVQQGTDDYLVGPILDDIKKILDNPATNLDSESVTNAVETLKELPRRYQTAAKTLILEIQRVHK